MIKFKIDYNREPWISKDWKSKHLIVASVHAMAGYMMGRAKTLSEEISYGDLVADHFELIGYMEPEKREELQTILSILKDAGIEVVEK